MNKKQLLELRKKISAKRPRFIRQDAMKVSRSRIPHVWRRPMGIHSKQRHGFAGHPACPSVGYRGPVETRGLHKTGLEQVLISNTKELEKIDPKKHGIIISAKTGMKKRLQIITEAMKKGISMLNIKNPAEFVKAVEEKMKDRKQAKELAKKEKESKTKEELEKKKESKEEAEKTKEQEKKELDKLLTKRGA